MKRRCGNTGASWPIPSSLDSLYAAIDYAVAEFRFRLDGAASGLDAAKETVSTATIASLMKQLDKALPAPSKNRPATEGLLPDACSLTAAYPNPFNPVTTLGYYLPEAGRVQIEVFNVMGQKVATLLNGTTVAGYNTVTWNADGMASGIYICRMEAEGHVATQKLMLMK